MLLFGSHRSDHCILERLGQRWTRFEDREELQIADSDDEIDEDIFDPYSNSVNPLWQLELAPGPSPMKIIVQFLGMGTPLD